MGAVCSFSQRTGIPSKEAIAAKSIANGHRQSGAGGKDPAPAHCSQGARCTPLSRENVVSIWLYTHLTMCPTDEPIERNLDAYSSILEPHDNCATPPAVDSSCSRSRQQYIDFHCTQYCRMGESFAGDCYLLLALRHLPQSILFTRNPRKSWSTHLHFSPIHTMRKVLYPSQAENSRTLSHAIKNVRRFCGAHFISF